MRALLLPACLLMAACGRYADFRLPDPGQPANGHWEWQAAPVPVMNNESVDTLNPSVLVWQGSLWNFYSVFDGQAWHSHSASSVDGRVWTGSRRFLSPDPNTWEGSYIAANGAAVRMQGEVLYFYQAGNPPRIGLARSADAHIWRKHDKPVLGFGPRGAWDERATADPYVIQADRHMYMYYLGEDRARRQRLGLAVSDDGLHWTKLRSSPILEPGGPGAFDENGVGEPAVWRSHGSYWMLYTGRSRDETRRLGLAQSRDGIHWQRLPLLIQGAQGWDAKVLCDPTVLVENDVVRVWFGGGDVAHPAENIHGQIGYGELRFKP